MKNNDRYKINLTLRVFDDKRNNYSIDEATDAILEFYSNSKRFNHSNFFIGFYTGAIIVFIILNFNL